MLLSNGQEISATNELVPKDTLLQKNARSKTINVRPTK